MKRLIKFINGSNSGKKILGLFLVTNIVLLVMLTVTIPKTMGFSKGMKLLDLMPTGYDLNYVNKLFNELGEIGQQNYLTNQLPVDMIYPLFFGLTYCLIIAYFLKKLNSLHTPLAYVCLLPIFSGIADYLENFGIIFMLTRYPNLTAITVETTSCFSVLKSVSTSAFFVVILILLLLLGLKIINKKRR